jgi:hypothetical protein
MNKSAFVFPYGMMEIKVGNVAIERRKKFN